MQFVPKRKYNVDILNLKPYNEVNIYPCHFCHSVSCIWSYTDGKESIHLCPSCSLELSDQIYFEKSLNEKFQSPSYYDDGESGLVARFALSRAEDDGDRFSEVKIDEDELRRELSFAQPH